MSDMKLTRAQIRAVFLDSGFTIKPGHDDLLPYVYKAAEALLRAYTGAAAPQDERAIVLPKIPDPCGKIGLGPGVGYVWDQHQVEDYARAAVLADRAALPAQAVDPVPVRMLPSPDLWRNGDGFQGYTAKPGDGPWYTAETVRALLEAPVQDVAPSAQQASELAADILIQLANEAPINGNNLAQRRVLWAAAQLRSGALQAVAKDVAPSDAPAVSNASIALPWPWETAAQVLADAIDRIEGQDKLKDALRILAAQPAAQPADAQDDMFWDKDNPESDLHAENLGEAIDYLADEIPLNELPIDVTLMRAKRLPNIRVRITGYVDGEGHTYEVITEARTQEGAAS